ncbi:hypothetical protein SCLCIDRAFT_1215531 [Scleroderma citrinum Foug A]|uniref:CRA domain-containing protein n=1 Tax=Scleroderma citrinum Foug A TaxID=1036808 RepID=A0A0C3E104_9AGAM|nr:hypothetical protein SCLCIDRAFT_1215531 [Scleroderma citrinum Foug A]
METRPDQLRALVLDYLCNNCYTKTALALSKDSAIMHLDRDGDEISESHPRGGTLTGLSGDVIRDMERRERIRIHILSGRVEEAIACLNEHFPKVLDESLEDEAHRTLSHDITSDQVQYRTTTINPVHLTLNLRVLAFIETCRTVPLIYPPLDSDSIGLDSPPHSKCPPEGDPLEEDRHQTELLIRAQKLYAHVNSLRNSADRALYLKELTNVGGLLAYTVPEKSPVARYLSQERRERVAEQINYAILRMPSSSSYVVTDLLCR